MASFDVNTTGDDVLKQFSQYAEGKTFVIIGPSENGIGAESAITLASAKPHKIILINPDIEVSFVVIDLLDNKSVRQAAEKIKTLTDKIDFIINNAGVMAVKHYATSVDVVESQFAANYLGNFLLTNLLVKEIVAAANMGRGARIVQVDSLGYQLGETNVEDINFKEKGITALICHPGVTLESKLLVNSSVDNESFADAYVLAIKRNDGNPLPPQNMVTLKQAAGVVLFTALNPSFRKAAPAFIVENAIYTETKEYTLNEETAEGLWKLSEKLVGETFVY
ncbi:hypothetical protein BOTNAR_0123g00130 [Botryotinia narcissicola]|uniref:NAD(P)-binding protein n=1 Tax=Botryotinia narcissicola TaxID=278944 RepID=A0A4Z1IK36_9HELO|nr:hypothetical protein BOTNAR_0123g00130 [Botryotinia narcissicola]